MKAAKLEKFRTITRALRHRNYRLYFIGQSTSLVGTWMQQVALAWLVYSLTHSAFLLGVVGFSARIPSLLFSPVAGVLADRWDRHRFLVITQSFAMVQALLLAGLVLTGLIAIWQIIVLAALLGTINAFDVPVRQSFMVQMVGDRNDLGNAIALNSSMVNGARLVGPSIAGLLIAAVGEGICFLINGISFLAVIGSLLMMKVEHNEHKARDSKPWQELKDGLRYAAGFEPIRAILLLLALASLMGMPYTVLMPIFAKDVLGGGPSTLGFLMGAFGVGALVGAIHLASRRSVIGLGRLLPRAAALFGLALVLFSFSKWIWLSLPLMFLAGAGQMTLLAGSNTLLQTLTDDDKRGRIMSLYATAFLGLMPVGSLAAGVVATHLGAQWTVMMGGTACMIGAGWYARRLPALRAKARPVYASKGIIPEIVSGIQSATDSPVAHKPLD